jgi:hypothetical protein
MSNFSRFLQGVVVAKDKSGAYVPKKYIVKRHGSGYLNGSPEYLNDALDGDYQRLVTEHGLEELSTGKSVHKDFTENSIAGAFHLESLPKFILDKDGNLRLFERGKYRIMEVQTYSRDGSIKVTYQDDSGNFKQESISKEAWGSWLLARDYVPTFESNREQSKFIESIPIEVLMHGNDKFNLEASRMKLTNGDCAKIKVDTSDGLEPKLAVFGFTKSDNGVCKVNSQVEIVNVSIAQALSNGVAVLDLSSCEKLSKVSLSGNFSEKFSAIFPSRHAKSLEISLDLSGSELNLVNFAEFTKVSEFKLLCLEYVQLAGDFPKKIKSRGLVRLTNVLGLPSSLSVEGCAADSWFCDLFDVTKISVTCPYTIPFFGSLNSLTELSIEATDTFSPYWFSSKFSKLRNLKVVKIKCRDFLGVSHYGNSYEVLSANFSSAKLERLEVYADRESARDLVIGYPSGVKIRCSVSLKNVFVPVNYSEYVRELLKFNGFIELSYLRDKHNICLSMGQIKVPFRSSDRLKTCLELAFHSLLLESKLFTKDCLTVPPEVEVFSSSDKRVVFEELNWNPSRIKILSELSINKGVFRGRKSLKEIVGSEYLVSVGEEAFAGTGLSKVMFGDKLREIKDRAFCLCDKLADVSIPNDCLAVKNRGIEESAFGACAVLSRDTIERLDALGINVYRGSSYIIWGLMRSRGFLVSKGELIKHISPDNLYYLRKVYSLIDKYGEVPLRTRRVSDAFRRDINNVKAYREQYNKEVSEHRRTGASLSEEALENEYSAMCLFKHFDYIAEDKL